jgi:hypothetical protein
MGGKKSLDQGRIKARFVGFATNAEKEKRTYAKDDGIRSARSSREYIR